MRARTTIKHLKARELGPSLRKRLKLAPNEEVEVTVSKRQPARKRTVKKDPWLAIKGTLTPEEADEMLRVIKSNRLSSMEAPDVDVP
ncbi:MAG: hypothetical protein ACREQI_15445 [Candidatus Binataceae bacterium]